MDKDSRGVYHPIPVVSYNELIQWSAQRRRQLINNVIKAVRMGIWVASTTYTAVRLYARLTKNPRLNPDTYGRKGKRAPRTEPQPMGMASPTALPTYEGSEYGPDFVYKRMKKRLPVKKKTTKKYNNGWYKQPQSYHPGNPIGRAIGTAWNKFWNWYKPGNFG